MAGASEVADLFVTVRAITDPAIKSLTELGAAGDRFATQIDAAMKTVTGAVAKLSESFKAVSASTTEMAGVVERDMGKVKTSMSSLSAESAGPLKAGFTEVGASADRMAVQVDSAMKKVQASATETAAAVQGAATKETAAYTEMSAKAKASSAEIAASNKTAADSAAVIGTSGEKAAAASAVAGTKISGAWKLAGLGVAAGVYEMVKAAGDFQQSGTRLVTTAGENAQVLESTVKPALLDIAATYGKSAQDEIKSMYDVESAGYHGAAGIGVMKAASQGAVMEQASLSTATGAVTTALVDYYPKMTNAGQVTQTAADIMAKMIQASKNGRMTLEDLTAGLHNVAPQAAAMGISLDQVLAIMATMTQHGMSVQQATENMNHAFQKFAGEGTQQMRTALQSFGISWQDLQKTIQDKGIIAAFEQIDQAARKTLGPNGQQVIQQWKDVIKTASPAVQDLATAMANGEMPAGALTKAINGLDEKDKVAAKSLRTLWDNTHGIGNEQVKGEQIIRTYGGAIKAMSGDMTTQKVIIQTTGEYTDRLNSAYKDIMGTTAGLDGKIKGIDESMGNWNNQVARVKTAIEVLGISLGSSLLGPLTAVAKAVADIIGWFAKHETAANALAKVLEFVLLAAIIGLSTKGIKALTNLALELPKDLIKMGAWVLTKTGLYKTVQSEADKSADKQIAAVQRASAAMEELALATEAAAAQIKAAYGVISTAAETSSATVIEADAAAGAAAEAEAATTTVAAGELATAETGVGVAAAGAAGAGGLGALLLAIGAIALPIVGLTLVIWGLTTHWHDFIDGFKQAWAGINYHNMFVQGFKDAWNDMKGIASSGSSAVDAEAQKVQQAYRNAFTPLPAITTGAMAGLNVVVNEGVHNIVAEVDKLSPLAKASLVQLAPAMREPTQAAVGGLLPIVTSGIQNIVNGIGLLPPHAQAILAPLPQAMQGPAQTALAGMLPIVTTGIDNITKAIGQAPPGATTALQPLPQALKNPTDTALGGMNTAVQTGLNKINQQFRKVGPDARTNVGDLSQTLQPAGQSAMSGFYQSMVNFYNSYIKPWLSSLASYIASLKGPVDKDRQLLVPHGTAIMAGLGEGLHTGFQKVIADVGTYSAQIRDAAAVNVPGAHLGSATGGGYNGVGGGGGSSYSASNANYYNSGGNTNYGATSNYANYQNSTGGGGDRDDGGGGGDMHFTFNGHVWDVEQLIREIQCRLQRHHIRNPTNGTSYVPTGTPATVITSTLSGPAQAGIC